MRFAHSGDVLAVDLLLREVSQHFPEIQGLNWVLKDLERFCQQEELLLIEDQVGILAVLAFIRSPQAWEVKFLATRVSGLRQGGMKRLMEHWLKLKPSALEAWLETQESNTAALNLYLSQGFRVVGRRPGYYANGEDALLLSYKSDNQTK